MSFTEVTRSGLCAMSGSFPAISLGLLVISSNRSLKEPWKLGWELVAVSVVIQSMSPVNMEEKRQELRRIMCYCRTLVIPS